MILHYANLMQAAGGVDAFIIGSEMRGLTTVRGAGNSYPSVTALQTLAADVRSVLGAAAKLTYAADWSEYFGHHPQDGSGDVRYHLDPLWADTNIDAVGIDAYFPLADWRDGSAHVDAQNYASIYDTDYLAANMEGGEGYDWYYATAADRDAQARSPITDGAANKPWVFRYKDVKSWWANAHYDRAGGIELSTPTAWQPQSKPIWFTEIGCPAIDKGANQPNVFWDPKSSESYAPYYSSAIRDDLIQRRYIETFLSYWDEAAGNNSVSSVYSGAMVAMDFAHIWTWDARPFPDFPARSNIWVDGVNWRTGHWISGRTGLVSLADIISDICLSTGAPAPDVSLVQGMVSGYVIDRPMSARAALSPLSIAYGFDLIERAGGLSFATRYTQISDVIDPQDLVYEKGADLLATTRTDAAVQLKDVRLSFIDQGRDYQAGLASARDLLAETVNILDVQAPLVLDPAQAKTIANALLERAINETESVEFSVPPQNLNLEAGDLVQLGGLAGYWQIENLDGLGKRSARARKADISAPLLQSGGEPGVGNRPGWVSAPDGFVLDIAGFTEDRSGPLVGVVVSPFVDTQITGQDGSEATPTAPVAIGALLQDFAPGPVGRYDNGSSIDIYLPGVALASLDEDGLLAGGNLLAVETTQGWEIFQCQNAELISEHTYRISRFLRGLYGTDRVLGASVPSGARIIYLTQGWQNLEVNTALRGSDIVLTLTANGRAAAQSIDFTYQAAHLRPLSPVHTKTKIIGPDLHISWTRRTRQGGDDWASLDVPLGEASEQYEIEFSQGGTLLVTKETNEPNLQIPISEIGNGTIDISITQISQTYGRGAARQITISI